MKNLILILTVVLSANACNKVQVNELIIGKWKRNGADVTMTFNDDRTVVQESNEPHYISYSGIYRIENNILYVDISSPTSGTFRVGEIVRINTTTLILKALYEFSFTRIN